jgi:hypothetical protein
VKKQRIHAAIEAAQITDAQKRILKMLVSSGHDLISFGVGTIATRLRLSDRTVQTALRLFQDAGLLTLVHREVGGRIPRVYKLNLCAMRGEIFHRSSLLGENFTAQFHRIYRETSSCVSEAAKQPPSQAEELPPRPRPSGGKSKSTNVVCFAEAKARIEARKQEHSAHGRDGSTEAAAKVLS